MTIGALQQIELVKEYEAELERVIAAKIQFETQIMTLQSAIANIETFKSMTQVFFCAHL